jgi:hypothetical protein
LSTIGNLLCWGVGWQNASAEGWSHEECFPLPIPDRRLSRISLDEHSIAATSLVARKCTLLEVVIDRAVGAEMPARNSLDRRFVFAQAVLFIIFGSVFTVCLIAVLFTLFAPE